MSADERATEPEHVVPPAPPAPSAYPAPADSPAAPGYVPPAGYAPPTASAPPAAYAPPAGYAPPVGYPPPPVGYPAPPAVHPVPAAGHPAPGGYAPAPPRGSLPWALGLLILIPFPFVGGIASGIAMATSGGASRRAGGVARENARSALNWGLTYLLLSTVLLVSHFLLLFTLTAGSPVSGFYPLGIPITIYLALSLLHVVLVIVGTVRTTSGKAMRVPFAIPYLRA